MTIKFFYTLSFLTGLGLVFIGAKFFIVPEAAEKAFGIRVATGGDYAFHYIKGIRDGFSGLLLCALVLAKQRRALGLTLVLATIVPTTDMLIVLHRTSDLSRAIPHLIAMLICLTAGPALLWKKREKKGKEKDKGETPPAGQRLQLTRASAESPVTVTEGDILPGEQTPWHYHTLFAETFEILEGSLELGKGKEVLRVHKGDKVTIPSFEKHYYKNTSGQVCRVKGTVSPGNRNFEDAIQILKGLAKDGAATAAGTPRTFADLALFVYLSDSKMTGLLRLVTPVMTFFARRSVKNGRLNALRERYCAVSAEQIL